MLLLLLALMSRCSPSNTKLISERMHTASGAQLPAQSSLFKANNYIEIILRRLTCITAVQMDLERNNSRVSGKRYAISKYSSMSAPLSRWYRCTGEKEKKRDINRFLEREHSRGPKNPSEKPINHTGFNELSFFRANLWEYKNNNFIFA